MRLIIVLATLMVSNAAFAAYDNSWYMADFWSGEWPNGYSVPKVGIKVPARTAMDKSLPLTLQCELPYKALFNPWNMKRKAKYMTASKIVKLKAKQNIVIQEDPASPKYKIKKGQTFEYLIYNSEGTFTARVNGKEVQASQDAIDKCEPVSENAFQEDQWLNIDCVNGVNAWIFSKDLEQTDANGNTGYKYGLWAGGIGGAGVVDYGDARDLTDQEISHGGPLGN